MKQAPISILILALCALLSCNSFYKKTIAQREHYKEDFLTDPRSPLHADDLALLDFYPPDKDAVVKAHIKKTPESLPFELPTYSGVTRTYRKYGIAYFKWSNDSARLSVYENVKLMADPQYQDYLFLPFTDDTNDNTTYGGGRYLDLSKADAEDGWIMIDFNTAYNPWCAFSDGYNCPIPPRENYLPFEVEAGEKLFKGEHKIPH